MGQLRLDVLAVDIGRQNPTTRRPYASINFVTAHDGFTLRDLVSYNDKRNEDNGEHNRDGETHNRSWNCGVEGPTADVDVLACRSRQQRNFLATLLLSQGVPMILGGDEMGRTQYGNNNAYCQDNEVSWYDWNRVDDALLDFVRRLIGFRAAHPVFRRRRFFQGRSVRGSGQTDIAWYRPDGREMTDEDWHSGFAKSLSIFLNGDGIPDPDRYGQPVRDESFMLLVNGHHDSMEFTLPPWLRDGRWTLCIDTHAGLVNLGDEKVPSREHPTVPGRCLWVLERESVPTAQR